MGSAQTAPRPTGHRYDALTIYLVLALVLKLRLSYRQLAAILELLAPWMGVGTPHFTTIRLWLLRLGLFALKQPLPTQPGGWTLLIDHTIGQGASRCFVILGLPTQQLPQIGYKPAHEDLQVLAVQTMEPSTGEQVADVLKQVVTRVGVVNHIVCDHGSDLLNGVARLREDYPDIVSTFDVRHLLACLLKRQLQECPRWKAFLENCGRVLPRLRQTAGNFLAPPALRLKARYGLTKR